MTGEIKVFIADDHPIFRHGLRQIIERAPQLVVVDEAEDGESAWQKLAATNADVAILDVDMPRRDGFEVARAIRDARLKIAVIFLTMHKDEHFLNQALDEFIELAADIAEGFLQLALRPARAKANQFCHTITV